MKKKPLIMIVLVLFLMTASPAAADADYTLQISDYTFKNEYDPVAIPSYLINGDVYVPLNVFADNFDVIANYDAGSRSINLDFGEAGGAEERLRALTEYVKNTGREIAPTPHRLFVQGKEIELPMLLVGGHNFVQIDVIAEGFGRRAVWNDESRTIALTQDELYGSPYLPDYGNYLKDNRIVLDLTDTSTLKGVDFDPYNVYLIGEQHAIAKNYDIQLYFIKYFNQNQNVRYIISEDGFCDTMLLNRYLETGDDSIIQNIVEGTKGSFAYSKNYYSFYEKVYEYNKSLPADQKLVFIGIDVQHNAQVGIDYLLTLNDQQKIAPASVRSALEALESRDEARVAEAVKLLAENEGAFREYYGDQFNAFYFGLRSVGQGIKFYEEHDYAVREGFIHENFRDHYETYGMKKCFGMFGGAHTLLNSSFGQTSNLAAYMNEEHEPTKSKVCSIMADYIDCFYMDLKTGRGIPVTYSQSTSVSRLLDESTDAELTLFPLHKKESPFAESGFTNSFQYYLCVKNSPAAIPYGELKAD